MNVALGRNQNIEIKARLRDFQAARSLAYEMATDKIGFQHQIDTYFACRDGRLKLREIDGKVAQLVWYCRPDETCPKRSDYCIVQVNDAQTFRHAMESAMGVRKVVDKRREILLYENVRIHLDDVKGLGRFLEFEAVLSPGDDEQSGHAKIQFLLDRFQIDSADLLANSYADMD